MKSILCTLLGHKYNTSDVASEAICHCCGHIRAAIQWPRLPEPKNYPPMPKVVRPVEVVEVTISEGAIVMAALENERSTLERMIKRARRDVDAANSRLRDLESRHSQAVQLMHGYVAACE